jgi:hypothetical protein
MDKQRVFVFEYRRRGPTKQWDAVDPGKCISSDVEDRWADEEVRAEEDHGRLFIRVCCEAAIEENDAMIAEHLAIEEFQRRFPGHTLNYEPDTEESVS